MRVEERAAMNLLHSLMRTEQQGQEHQVKLLRKVMNAQKEQGQQLVQMIQDAGRMLDIRA